MQWFSLKPVDLTAFAEAEKQLHWASQLVAMAGNAFLPHKEDDRHTSMRWEPGTRRLVSGLITAGGTSLQVAVNVEHFLLQIVEENGVEIFTVPMHQRTMLELSSWLGVQLRYLDLDSSRIVPLTHFELPEHPIGEGQPFQKPAPELLQAWVAQRSDAQFLLQAPRIRFKAYDYRVAVWPHHFDSGLFIPLPDKSIGGLGMGWAPADSLVSEPYLYAYPLEKSDGEQPRESSLSCGYWPEGYGGAVLPFSQLAAEKEPSIQHKMGASFLKEATDYLIG